MTGSQIHEAAGGLEQTSEALKGPVPAASGTATPMDIVDNALVGIQDSNAGAAAAAPRRAQNLPRAWPRFGFFGSRHCWALRKVLSVTALPVEPFLTDEAVRYPMYCSLS